MKCPKCGSEQTGGFCAECGEKLPPEPEKTNEQNEAINAPNPAVTNDTKPEESSPKFLSMRTILEIVCGLLIAIMCTVAGQKSGVSEEDYEQLQADYDTLQTTLEETTASLDEVTANYESYKSEMSKFEDMPDEEIDAIIAELDAQAAEEQAAAEAAAAEEQARQEAIESATTEQLNALSSAESYISFMGFSYSGLIDQLEYEGYSTDAATYAADNCGADWNEEAAESAQDYMDVMSFSRQGLIDQLLYEGFTQEQAEYGASAVGY